MKLVMIAPTGARVTPEERRAKRPIGRDVETYQKTLSELEMLAVACDQTGVDAFGVTEHHFHTEGNESIPNNLLWYAKLAAKTERLKYIPLSIVLPANDPIRVAENVALFDNMYPDRLAGVCFARGYVTRWMQTLRQQERVGAGPIDLEANALNREIFNEYLEVVKTAWSEDTFNFNGKHYQAPYPASGIPNWPVATWTREYGGEGEVDDEGTIHKIGVVPKPLKEPEIWIPYTHSYETLRQVAQQQYTTIVYDGQPDRFRKACEDYQAEAAKVGLERKLGQGIAPLRKIYIGDTFEEAFELGVRTGGYWFNNYFSLWGVNEQSRIPSDDPNKMVTFSSDRECAQRMYDQGQMLCGTADDVSRQLDARHRCHGDDGDVEWLIWEYWVAPDTPRERQLDQLHLFMDKVWPRFK